jgi:SAM-dependent methyltransferase
MNSRDQQISLTERSYWEGTWQIAELPKLFDPSDRSLRNGGNIAFHNFFSEILRTASLQNGSLVEIGCAQSKWLPYFNKEHGLSVAGLDYTELGCARARALLRQAGCPGMVVQADMFNPPEVFRSRFDVVLSMGLVEHFPDTASAVAACAALAKPGGIVITTIPNLSGIVGRVQRRLDRSVYDKHVPLDCNLLRAAHEKCGLSILRSEYLMSANFAIINHPALKPKIINSLTRGILVAATAAVWAIERSGVHLPATQLFSPYAACVARKSVSSAI